MIETNYAEARDAGYDGSPPLLLRRRANMLRRNAAMDCRDPDHDERLCKYCSKQTNEDDDHETTD